MCYSVHVCVSAVDNVCMCVCLQWIIMCYSVHVRVSAVHMCYSVHVCVCSG